MTAETLTPGPRYVPDTVYTVEAALFDVDNTLVANASPDVPSERFRAAVAAARGRIPVALATARPLSKVAHIMDHIGADGLSILCNGAQICDSRTRQIVAEWPLAPETCSALLVHVHELGLTYWINDDGVDYFPVAGSAGTYEKQEDIWGQTGRRIAVPGYVPAKPFVVVMHDISAAESEDMRSFVANYGDPDATTLIAHEFPQPDGSMRYDQFIVHRRANKEDALQEVLRRQGLTPEHLMAVGDGRNDAVLVGAAGIGVAMGNSAVETLQAATFVAPDQWDDGAAVALEHFTVTG